MGMSRKHYKMVAQILNEQNDPNDVRINNHTYMIAKEFIREFKKDNPLFDEERFIDACKIDMVNIKWS